MKLAPVLVAAALLTGAAAEDISRAQALAFHKKLTQIVQRGESGGRTPLHTTVTQGEVNSYLRFSAGDQLPTGVTDPRIAIQGGGRLNGRAIVDLDVIRRNKSSGSLFDPMNYLTGRLPVTATGTLQTHAGRGRFTLESAEISGVPIPKTLLQELVTYYTRRPEFPNGINIDAAFDLPAAIQKIEVQSERALIIQ